MKLQSFFCHHMLWRRDEFVKTQISESFHEPIHQCKISTFKVMTKKTTTSNNMSIEVNRDIFGRLLSISSKESKSIDFVKALPYPLSEVPLSLANADDTIRKTNKSKLANIIIQRLYNRYIKAADCLYHWCHGIYKNYGKSTWYLWATGMQFLSGIPKGFSRIDLLADSCFNNSIKDAERIKRGTSRKIIVRSMKSKLPSEFSQFLSCGEQE